MKLASHYNKASIIISASILLISGFIYYLIIDHIARAQLDNDLGEELAEVVDYVNQYHQLPKQVDFDEDVTTFVRTDKTNIATSFFDTPYKNPKEEKTEEGRAISALIKVNGQNYIVRIVESREETESLIQIISAITAGLSAVLLTVLVTTNRFVLNGLWKPFYAILQQVKNFSVSDAARINEVKSNVDEFKELSDAVSKMSSRVASDYESLKTFTENASHEMMTPLAVITSKLDMLIQDDRLEAEQFSQITDIYQAAGKLSRLNQSLLLLVKIDHDLLQDTEDINLKTVILEKVQQFQEMMHNKHIALQLSLQDTHVRASKYLAEVLINNLFGNAIRHNSNPGEINIELAGGRLCFRNTGDPVPLDQDAIFERFYKGRKSEGTGLGLAIMKNICTRYHFDISYQFKDGRHCFGVDLAPAVSPVV